MFGPTIYEDPPLYPAPGQSILLDGFFDWPAPVGSGLEVNIVIQSIQGTMPDVLEVIFSGPLFEHNVSLLTLTQAVTNIGLASIHKHHDSADPHWEIAYVFINPNKCASYKLLPHEIGHALTNQGGYVFHAVHFLPGVVFEHRHPSELSPSDSSRHRDNGAHTADCGLSDMPRQPVAASLRIQERSFTMVAHNRASVIITVIMALQWIQPAAVAQTRDEPPLDDMTLREMKRILQRPTFMYEGLDIFDPRDANAFIEIIVPSDGRMWMHGVPRNLFEVIAVAPAHFAPAIRERLMRLPATVDEYLHDSTLDHPKYSITMRKSADGHSYYPPQADMLLAVASYLDRANAEPILRDFHDQVQALQRQAQAAVAALKRRNADSKKIEQIQSLWISSSVWREDIIRAATKVGSPIFVDEALDLLLGRVHDDAFRATDATATLPYLEQFALIRPDVYVRLKQLEQDLASHEWRTDEEQRLLDALRPTVQRMERILLPPQRTAPQRSRRSRPNQS